jgi:hypothetical protein
MSTSIGSSGFASPLTINAHDGLDAAQPAAHHVADTGKECPLGDEYGCLDHTREPDSRLTQERRDVVHGLFGLGDSIAQTVSHRAEIDAGLSGCPLQRGKYRQSAPVTG